MRPVVFKEAGKIMLVYYNPDGTLSRTPTNIVSNIGKVASIAPSVTWNTSNLTDGNSPWDMHFDTTQTGQIVVTMSEFQPKLYAALIGTKTEIKTNKILWAIDEEFTIEADATVTLAHTPKTDGAIVVIGGDGTEFTKAETGPTAGQYTIATNKLTFATEDVGKAVFVTYEWEASDVLNFGLPAKGSRPALHAVVSGLVSSADGVTNYYTNIFIDKCKATGDLASPQMGREPQPWNFTLQVLPPRPGIKPVDYDFAPSVTV